MSWFNSIRTRLIIILIAFALIPFALAIGLVVPTVRQSSQKQTMDSLEAIAALKENQILLWTEELQNSLATEIERDVAPQRLVTLLRNQPETPTYDLVYQAQLDIFTSAITSRGVFEEFFVLDKDGNVILSTDSLRVGRNFSTQPFFERGLLSPTIQPPTYDAILGHYSVIAARPIQTEQGEVLGLLAGRSPLANLNDLMAMRQGLGETGETYLVGKDGILLTDLLPMVNMPSSERPTTYQIGIGYIRTEGSVNATSFQHNGSGAYLNYQDLPVFGVYHWIPELSVAMLVELRQSEAQSTVLTATRLISGVVVATLVFSVLAALLISANLSRPVANLTTIAGQIAAGNLDLRVTSTRRDEIGLLSQAFNAMTARLHSVIDSLEDRVAERTAQIEKRSDQLQAATEVSRSVTTILDTNTLIQSVVDLIQQRFDLYYVGLFLVDENREWAVLRAGTGQAGQAMLERGHRLHVGGGSMIGWSIANAQSRIALEAGEDPVRLATADLPDTRSEAAIPLRSRGQVLGAISVQSAQPNAFDRETITVFQNMADQIAIALDNARLFAQAQQTLETVHQAYGDLSHQAWMERLQTRSLTYRRDIEGTRRLGHVVGSRPVQSTPAAQIPSTGQEASLGQETSSPPQTPERVVIPIRSRGQTIGYIDARRPSSSLQKQPSTKSPVDAASPKWRPEELNLLETLVDQLGVTLDSARLFEETQQSAERERLIGEITSQMRATLDIDTVMQTAVREMRRALDLQEVEIRLGTTPGQNPPVEQATGTIQVNEKETEP
jgi:GAF domain-containing protein/HAMP domain-containing protein